MTEGVELTVGRHAADDGAEVHPIVAAALRQAPGGLGVPRHSGRGVAAGPAGEGNEGNEGNEGGLGWPGDPHEGDGLGWPAGDAAGDRPGAEAPPATGVTERPARRRLGWRRIFGGPAATPASADTVRDTSAA